MTNRSSFFHYKQGRTIFHLIPAVPKILGMIALSIGAFYVPVIPAVAVYVVLILTAFFYLQLTVKEIWSDNKPAFYYGVLLIFTFVTSNIIQICKTGFNSTDFIKCLAQIFKPDTSFLPLLVHTALSLEITSIFFRTTGSMQLMEGLTSIEVFITKKPQATFTTLISLTITFIPRIAGFWQQLSYSWKNRGGKENVKKISHLFPFLFKVSMQDAYQKSLSRMNRQ